MRERVPGPRLSGNASDPLVMVYDAEGRVIMSGHLGAKTSSGQQLLDSLLDQGPQPVPEQSMTIN